jgi:hypothetical protein
MCRLSRNYGASTSWIPQGPLQACSGKALPFYTERVSNHLERGYNERLMKRPEDLRGLSGVWAMFWCDDSNSAQIPHGQKHDMLLRVACWVNHTTNIVSIQRAICSSSVLKVALYCSPFATGQYEDNLWRMLLLLRRLRIVGWLKAISVQAPRTAGGWDRGFSDSRHLKVARLSALRIGRLYPLGKIPGTHFC